MGSFRLDAVFHRYEKDGEMPRSHRLILVGFVLVTAAPVLSQAAPPAKKGASADLAVDVVDLKPSGPSLRGAVIRTASDGTVVLAVSRPWLQKNAAALYEKHAAEERTARQEQLVELMARMTSWRTDRDDQKRLTFFLDEERRRLSNILEGKADDPALESPFVVMELKQTRVRRVTGQPAAKKQVALAAWQADLADVESRSVADLEAELKERNIDAQLLAVDLSARLAPSRDTAAQWAARRAIVEYELCKPLDFQGTGDVLVRIGDEEKPQMASLIGELFTSQLGRDLGDLLGTPNPVAKPSAAPFEKATKAAEKEQLAGVRVTRVDQNLTARRVVVAQHFLVRLDDKTWHTAWSWTETADASKPRPDAEARIEKDPQIKQALELVKSIGLGGDAGDTLQTAVRFGAAVMEAQKSADGRFFQFRDACLRKLDGPPFPWSGPAAAVK